MPTYKPVRKIGVQSRSITGTRPDTNRYESALERDFMELVAGDPDYDSYSAQPLYVHFINPLTGRAAKYPPDGLVEWKSDRRPLLVEIKYRENCAGLWRILRAKFRAAKAVAHAKGWDFAVILEEDVRGPILYNVRFLSGYKNRSVDHGLRLAIVDLLNAGPHEARLIVASLKDAGFNGPEAVSCMWSMVAHNEIKIDMNIAVTMASLVWMGEDKK